MEIIVKNLEVGVLGNSTVERLFALHVAIVGLIPDLVGFTDSEGITKCRGRTKL